MIHEIFSFDFHITKIYAFILLGTLFFFEIVTTNINKNEGRYKLPNSYDPALTSLTFQSQEQDFPEVAVILHKKAVDVTAENQVYNCMCCDQKFNVMMITTNTDELSF